MGMSQYSGTPIIEGIGLSQFGGAIGSIPPSPKTGFGIVKSICLFATQCQMTWKHNTTSLQYVHHLCALEQSKLFVLTSEMIDQGCCYRVNSSKILLRDPQAAQDS
jgi:hypothetical protein